MNRFFKSGFVFILSHLWTSPAHAISSKNASVRLQSNGIITPASIAFTSAVTIESSASVQSAHLANIPSIALPTNISNYDSLSQLAYFMPALQRSIAKPDTASMLAALKKTMIDSVDNINSLGTERQPMRIMIVGDSMSQGAQGDWTWRYRIWEWFRDQEINVDFVGPYKGTQEPDLPVAPSPPPLYDASQTSNPVKASGGYAVGVSPDFNSNHFAVWGRAAAVDKGLIQDVVTAHPADLMLLMLGFNDMGWFYSDAPGTLDSTETLIQNARAAAPNLKFAVANVPQRTRMNGRDDLPLNTDIYNSLLRNVIPRWSTPQSPIHLVELQENYDCGVTSCPAAYDDLHPNALGEYEIARAFTLTLVNDFKIGTSVLAIPDEIPARPLPVPSNFQVLSSPGGITATWDPVYGAYSYDVSSRISGITEFSIGTVSSNRWDARWPVDGLVYEVQVRACAGKSQKGEWTTVLSATAHPLTAPGPLSVVVEAIATGLNISWDPPTGPYTDSIIEYNVMYLDKDDHGSYIQGAAFVNSPAHINNLVPGHHYFVALITWNAAGEGFPEVVNSAVIGAGTPPPPTDLTIVSNDDTSIHMTWIGSVDAGGYQLWSRNVKNASSVSTRVGNVDVACADVNGLFEGTWNYEWCVSAYNGNAESERGDCVVAPSPASGTAAETCGPEAAWRANGNDGSNEHRPTSTAIPGSNPARLSQIPYSVWSPVDPHVAQMPLGRDS